MGLALLVSVLGLAPAGDEVELEWNAPPECPRAEQVRAELEAMSPPGARGSASARVHREADGFRLELTVGTEQGRTTRELRADACDALGTAAAVIVAVALDPVAAEARRAVPPAPTVVEPPPRAASVGLAAASGSSSTPREPEPARPEPPRSSSPREVIVGAVGGLGVGVLPSPHPWAGARVGLRWRWLETQVGATHHLAQPADRPLRGGGADISLTAVHLSAGPTLRRRRASVHLLGGLEGGVMLAAGRDLAWTRTAASPWLALVAQPGVAWVPSPWVAFRATVTLGGALARPRFRTEEGTIIHRSPPLSARIGLGLEIRIPIDQTRRSRRPR